MRCDVMRGDWTECDKLFCDLMGLMRYSSRGCTTWVVGGNRLQTDAGRH